MRSFPLEQYPICTLHILDVATLIRTICAPFRERYDAYFYEHLGAAPIASLTVTHRCSMGQHVSSRVHGPSRNILRTPLE